MITVIINKGQYEISTDVATGSLAYTGLHQFFIELSRNVVRLSTSTILHDSYPY